MKSIECVGVRRVGAPVKRLTPFVRSMFPLHSLRDTPPRAGVHFTETCLHHMTPWRKAARIADLLDDYLSDHFQSSYALVDACAGIGGNGMVFAARPRVADLWCLERDAAVFAMLRTNLSNVRARAARVHALHRECSANFLRSLTSPVPVGVFVDPPWGAPAPPYSDVLTMPLNEEGETVMDWVAVALANPVVRVVMVKVPKGQAPPDNVSTVFTAIAKMDMLLFHK